MAIDKQNGDKEYNEMTYNVIVMKPGNRLRELRKAAGLTQGELAELSGVSQPAISQLENGLGSFDIPWMRAFARILKCSPADFLDDDDNPDRLDEAERALIERFRHANAAQRQTLERVAAAVIPDEDQAGNVAGAA